MKHEIGKKQEPRNSEHYHGRTLMQLSCRGTVRDDVNNKQQMNKLKAIVELREKGTEIKSVNGIKM